MQETFIFFVFGKIILRVDFDGCRKEENERLCF
jgi:hypothetical protein